MTAGFIGQGAVDGHGDGVNRMIDVIITEIRLGPFDFSDRRFGGTLRDEGATIASDKAAWHIPLTRPPVCPAQDRRHRAACGEA